MMCGTHTLFLSHHSVVVSKAFLGLLCLCGNLKTKIKAFKNLVNLVKIFLNKNSVTVLKNVLFVYGCCDGGG